MLDLFTEVAIQSILLGHELARSVRSEFVQDEHLLLGLIAQSAGVAKTAFMPMGLEFANARTAVENLERGSRMVQASTMLTFGSNAVQALEQAWTVQQHRGDAFISSGHILVGVLSVQDGTAIKALARLNVDCEQLQSHAIAAFSNTAAIEAEQELSPKHCIPLEVQRRLSPALFLALTFAEQEARRTGHEFLGSEHLLVGVLLKETDIAKTLLANSNVSLDELRGQILETIGPGFGWTGRQMAFTPMAIRILQDALAYAKSEAIEPKHVLLALAAEPKGIAARILGHFKLELSDTLCAH